MRCSEGGVEAEFVADLRLSEKFLVRPGTIDDHFMLGQAIHKEPVMLDVTFPESCIKTREFVRLAARRQATVTHQDAEYLVELRFIPAAPLNLLQISQTARFESGVAHALERSYALPQLLYGSK